ncbi:MAG: hypothetical protein GC146_13100 [Limimaricola sp.]|uniref:hypothetical protein n=1 Tax=Limimaricola sp. TaxID=2211665 RepID=UPI001D90EA05|nr:hypothetical protein [Limimaricola sp.]MBI1418153.1 hypothetical protein [Limimaricola sp.]
MKIAKSLSAVALCLALGATSATAGSQVQTSNDNNNGILIAAVVLGFLLWFQHENPKAAPATRGKADPSAPPADGDVLMKF